MMILLSIAVALAAFFAVALKLDPMRRKQTRLATLAGAVCVMMAMGLTAHALPIAPPGGPYPDSICDPQAPDFWECIGGDDDDSGDYGQFPSDYTGGGRSDDRTRTTISICESSVENMVEGFRNGSIWQMSKGVVQYMHCYMRGGVY